MSKTNWKYPEPALLALTALAGLALLTACPPAAWGQEKKAAEEKPAPKPEKSQVRKALDRLKDLERKDFFDTKAGFASSIREIVLVGKEGVPELIDELDTTQNERIMRCLGFALRAIGDKRAVPALVRAIPKTCLAPASDYGAKVDDPELMAFMMKHDTDEVDRDPNTFHFDKPVPKFLDKKVRKRLLALRRERARTATLEAVG